MFDFNNLVKGAHFETLNVTRNGKTFTRLQKVGSDKNPLDAKHNLTTHFKTEEERHTYEERLKTLFSDQGTHFEPVEAINPIPHSSQSGDMFKDKKRYTLREVKLHPDEVVYRDHLLGGKELHSEDDLKGFSALRDTYKLGKKLSKQNPHTGEYTLHNFMHPKPVTTHIGDKLNADIADKETAHIKAGTQLGVEYVKKQIAHNKDILNKIKEERDVNFDSDFRSKVNKRLSEVNTSSTAEHVLGRLQNLKGMSRGKITEDTNFEITRGGKVTILNYKKIADSLASTKLGSKTALGIESMKMKT